MTVKFAKYDGAGRILFCGEVPEHLAELQGENCFFGEADPRTDYILGGEKVARPVFPVSFSDSSVVANGNDELVIYTVPAGTRVHVAGPVKMEGTTDAAGDVTLTFASPGTYTVTLTLFPYQDLKETIHAA